jgi:hypothetical protein
MNSPTAISRRKLRKVNRPFAVLFALALITALIAATLINPATRADASSANDKLDLNKTPVADYNINLGKNTLRLPAPSQLQALDTLKANLGDENITARWDKSTGSVDTVMDFASPASPLEPEAAARNFIQANAGLFGLTDMDTLRLKRNTAALGGNLLYFEQTYQGLPVAGGGIGVVLDGERRVKSISGPYQKDLNLNIAPSLDAATAIAAAQTDLAQYRVKWVAGVADVLNPALDKLATQLGPDGDAASRLKRLPDSRRRASRLQILLLLAQPVRCLQVSDRRRDGRGALPRGFRALSGAVATFGGHLPDLPMHHGRIEK